MKPIRTLSSGGKLQPKDSLLAPGRFGSRGLNPACGEARKTQRRAGGRGERNEAARKGIGVVFHMCGHFATTRERAQAPAIGPVALRPR